MKNTSPTYKHKCLAESTPVGKLLIRTILTFSLSYALFSCAGSHMQSDAKKASEFRASKDYDEAIKAYIRHIDKRVKTKEKPEWENPYIYYLDIGDIYLQQENIEKALEYYLLADKENVKKTYVNDRLRNIGDFLVEKKEFERAIEHLTTYRERDPLLFDLMRDRIAKQIVAQEDTATTDNEH